MTEGVYGKMEKRVQYKWKLKGQPYFLSKGCIGICSLTENQMEHEMVIGVT